MLELKAAFITAIFFNINLIHLCLSIDNGVEKYNIIETNFKSKKIINTYLVTFKNYYWQSTREKYLKAAISKQNVSDWLVSARPKLSYLHPSDFEVIQTSEIILNVGHPTIKAITFQKHVERKLKYNVIKNSTGDGNLNNHLLEVLNVNVLWDRGITGKDIKVAVFDTGLSKDHPHFRNVKEITNWTNDKSVEDGVSHGTFVSGIIASSKECLGIAPDVDLHIFRVFTNTQISYTSWFLDAFNYALFKKINVLNLSIGGPDFMDQPFIDKVQELSANGIIIVSAIGNDGPLYGTLNNPADQSDVIGVGGINFDDVVARFSSRGMTTWELPSGYGRLKPDIVTYGNQVKGSDSYGGCRSLSGTSVASPVVSGAVALILSGAPEKLEIINPASVKQILIEGATKLKHSNMFEQGSGKLNILQSMDIFYSYKPKVTFYPNYIDFNEPYMWPYSSQPMYCSSLPSIVNITILNGISVKANIITAPIWYPNLHKNGNFLDINITYSSVLWPWTGWMALKISIKEEACYFEGESKGHIIVQIEIPQYESKAYSINVIFPVNIKITPKPPRHKRILWDQYHNLQYPPRYIPRDNLKLKLDQLDWRSDHIHTNFRDMYQHLRSLGYYVETLGMPFTCFNASNYGTLLIVDPEEEFLDKEIYKLQRDVFYYGLSVIIFAEWYNTSVMNKIKFFDENTREWWTPDTGGANIPSLNDLLQGFGISLTDDVVEGYFRLGEHNLYYGSGTTLRKFPMESSNIIITANLYDQGYEIITNLSTPKNKRIKKYVPVIGLFQMHQSDMKIIEVLRTSSTLRTEPEIYIKHNVTTLCPVLKKRFLLGSESAIFDKIDNKKRTQKTSKSTLKKDALGRFAIIGDSNCIDSTFTQKYCLWLLKAFLEYTMNSYKSPLLNNLNTISYYQNTQQKPFPENGLSSRLQKFSKVIKHKNNFNKYFKTFLKRNLC